MENLIKDLENYSKKMIESADKLQRLAEQQVEALEDLIESMNYARIEWQNNSPIKPDWTPEQDFAREEFEQMTPLKVTHE